MAHYHVGFTRARLVQIYAREASTADDARILAGFGRPLSRSTQESYGLVSAQDGHSVPHAFLDQRGLLTYNELGHAPHYVDQLGRQYFAYGSDAPSKAYCRIPKSLTVARNRGKADNIELPWANEAITLTYGSAWGRASRNDPPIDTTVLQRLDQTESGAVALLLLSDELMVPDGLDAIQGDEGEERAIDPIVRGRLRRIDSKVERRAALLREQGVTLPDNQEHRKEKTKRPRIQGPRPLAMKHLPVPKMRKKML